VLNRLDIILHKISMVKVKLTVSIIPELIHWIDEEVEQGHFANRSHAVQYSLLKVKELIKKEELKF
jgi:Arc/MetJ-type ribon-helix-helix transcriptional regulator